MGEGDLGWSRSAGIRPGSGSIFEGRRVGSISRFRLWFRKAAVGQGWLGDWWASLRSGPDCEAGEGKCHSGEAVRECGKGGGADGERGEGLGGSERAKRGRGRRESRGKEESGDKLLPVETATATTHIAERKKPADMFEWYLSNHNSISITNNA